MTTTMNDLAAEAVRVASARWLAAVDTRDADRIAAFYADDGVFLVPNAPAANGRGQVRGVWTQLLSAPNLSLTWTPNSVEVSQAGDLASEVGTYQLGMDGPAGRIEDDGKYVVVWRRGASDWEVAADIFNSNRSLPLP
jgi:uncharacterized protein (TIGR02246 family)